MTDLTCAALGVKGLNGNSELGSKIFPGRDNSEPSGKILNGAAKRGPGRPKKAEALARGYLDFKAIEAALLTRAHDYLLHLLPGGELQGHEYVVKNPTRSDGEAGSFKVNIKTGKWGDFASGPTGRNLLDLAAEIGGAPLALAAREAAAWLGIDAKAPAQPAADVTLEAYAKAKRLDPAFLQSLGLETVKSPYRRQQVLAIPYRDADGKLLRTRYRVAITGKNKHVWDKAGGGVPGLYGLERLPDSATSVFLVEGESDVHTLLSRGHAALGVPGVLNFRPDRDADALAGLDVIVIQEPDAGGETLLKRLRGLPDTSRIKVARLDGFKDVSELHIKAPERFDTALEIAIRLAKPLAEVKQDRPAEPKAEPEIRLETREQISAGDRQKLPDGFRYTKDSSIEFLSPKKTDDGDEIWAWLCSPLEILAETHGEDEKGWGLLIRVKTPDGVWHTQAMSRALFMAEGGEASALLFDLGLKITAAKAGKDRLRALLCMSSSRKRARTAIRVGWYGPRTFILPDEAFGECGDEHIVYQPERPIAHAYKLKGSLDGWRGEVAARAIGNSRLAFAASVAFAGPMLQPLCIEGGGFHMRGDGSCGKTTALWIAGSAWGGGPITGFLESWRTTDNGLEASAVQHSDTFMGLDELGQAAAASAAKTIYMVANGQGKRRAGIGGEGRPVAEFRVLFLSTGEVSLATKLAEDGLNSMAGQETRFVDLEADAGVDMGAFENIHGAASPAAFSDAIRTAAATHYGHASRAFLRRLLAAPEDAFAEAHGLMDAFVNRTCPTDATGQVARVAKRFAIVAASGKLATQWGVLPWPEHHAMDASARMFREWLGRRGSTGALESVKALEQVRSMIERHGASRFVPWSPDQCPPVPSAPVINRLGFVRRDDEHITYYVLAGQFKDEICKGLDAMRVAKELVRIGAITPDKNGKRATSPWLPGIGTARCYVIDAAKLFADGTSQ